MQNIAKIYWKNMGRLGLQSMAKLERQNDANVRSDSYSKVPPVAIAENEIKHIKIK